jgi:hypothetical protein
MNSSTPSFDYAKNWAESQQKVWDGWFDAVRQYVAIEPTQPLQRHYDKSLATGEKIVKGIVGVQAEAVRNSFAALMTQPEGTQPLASWAKMGQQMCDNWETIQTRLWDLWFESLKSVRISYSRTEAEGSWEALWEDWQAVIQGILKLQADFAQQLIPPIETAKAPGPRKQGAERKSQKSGAPSPGEHQEVA